MGQEFYTDLVNKCYGLEGSKLVALDESQDLVVKQAEDHFRTLPDEIPEFDHYSPASYLIEHWAKLQPEIRHSEDALNRFDALFTDLNVLLPNN
ncbi:MAG: hypothetical protein IIB31_03540 [Chloroflexi bacterium]|nr:hypothetical protein [Chloroflexota bacterium]